MRSRINRNLKN